MTSCPEAVSHTANELTVPQEPRRRVSIASDPPTIVDGRRSPYFGLEPRRRLSVASSELQASDGRRKSILVQHTPETMSLHSQHSGNNHYVNHGFQHDGKNSSRFTHRKFELTSVKLALRSLQTRFRAVLQSPLALTSIAFSNVLVSKLLNSTDASLHGLMNSLCRQNS
jgi:hypothetical protein